MATVFCGCQVTFDGQFRMYKKTEVVFCHLNEMPFTEKVLLLGPEVMNSSQSAWVIEFQGLRDLGI